MPYTDLVTEAEVVRDAINSTRIAVSDPALAPAITDVTNLIEEELNTISDLKELTSTSVEGYSSIVAEFETTVDLEEALAQVREKREAD